MGDLNIDFLRYLNHQPTEKYLDMLYTNNTIPVITKPTRITNHTKTLIDHIYTNTLTSQIISGVAFNDISDHLPVFCIINTPIKRSKEKQFFRNFDCFNADSYLDDMRRINWNDKLLNLSTDLNKTTQDVINVINEMIDKHVPIKEASQSKLKQLNKPWMTTGLLKSIRTKQRMYRTHFYSNNKTKIEMY